MTEIEQKIDEYARMAKAFMNKPMGHPNDVVGNYEWHEQFPYERHLLYRPWSETPVLPIDRTKIAIDFGCGPGRMIRRMSSYFARVDGIDVSSYALAYAREQFPQSNFFESSGADVGDTPSNTYDFLYSTISIQHISVRTIRQKLYGHFKEILKPGGCFCLQLAYHPTYMAGIWAHDTEHARYNDDFFSAKATNGHADMVINEDDLPQLRKDFEELFQDIELGFVNVSQKYANLNGVYHAPYWADSWLFVHGKKAA